jgi:hypothetical protein
MRRAWKITTMAIVMGCGAIIAAQNQRPEQAAPTASASQSKPAMMVTGCVQRAEQAGATGTSGVAGATTRAGSGASELTLINAVVSGSASAAPTTTGGTSTTTGGGAAAATDAPRAAAPAATSGATYMLDDPSNKLAAHVGHKVEITGTLAPSATASASGSTARASAGQRLAVSEVKMISADCSAK